MFYFVEVEAPLDVHPSTWERIDALMGEVHFTVLEQAQPRPNWTRYSGHFDGPPKALEQEVFQRLRAIRLNLSVTASILPDDKPLSPRMIENDPFFQKDLIAQGEERIKEQS